MRDDRVPHTLLAAPGQLMMHRCMPDCSVSSPPQQGSCDRGTIPDVERDARHRLTPFVDLDEIGNVENASRTPCYAIAHCWRDQRVLDLECFEPAACNREWSPRR